jgi:C-terminal processing protease CtpA/Prc
MLEDQVGFITRDEEFKFALTSQTIGPVIIHEDNSLTYHLSLPAVPQGTQVDVDNDNEEEQGVQVFAIAYWSNTWGGPFLEERDGTGWSTAYASTITDPQRENEIVGGILVVWAPDDNQDFPTSFGQDGLLFTDDDPVSPIPPGYNLIDIDQDPFVIYKEAQPFITLHEGELAVNDFSEVDYQQAFRQMFEKISLEYPFTADKEIDWEALFDSYSSRINEVRDDEDFFLFLHDFASEIPDGHVGVSFNDLVAEIFFEKHGGSFGLVLSELSDNRVIVTEILPQTPGERAGIQEGAEIIEWDGMPVTEAVAQAESFFGPYSSEHHERLEKIVFMTRVPPDEQIEVAFQNPDAEEAELVPLKAEVEYESLFRAIPTFTQDELAIPVMGEVLDESGLGYIQINTFSDDYNLTAQLWDRYINELIDLEIPALILDIRVNGGGSSSLASDFAGYFFNEELTLGRRSYYNDITGEFEYREHPSRVEPGPAYYEGHIAVLISPYCVSACEGFAYALAQLDHSILVGHFPTAGAFGEVGRGQYQLPGDFSMQFPTGRSETPDGVLLIEGTGVVPDLEVPITEESALGLIDAVFDAAVDNLLKEINQ